MTDLTVFGGVPLNIVIHEGRQVRGKGRAWAVFTDRKQQLGVHWIWVDEGEVKVRQRVKVRRRCGEVCHTKESRYFVVLCYVCYELRHEGWFKVEVRV